MKRTLHKALSILLTAAMVLNMGLTPVFATETALPALPDSSTEGGKTETTPELPPEGDKTETTPELPPEGGKPETTPELPPEGGKTEPTPELPTEGGKTGREGLHL